MINVTLLNQGVINDPDRMEYGFGSLISIEQIVEFSESGSGSLISIIQNVSNSGSGSLISITQLVRDTSVASFYDRNGWYGYLYIDGLRIPDNQIHGPIEIRRVENDAAFMSFVLLPPRGAIDLTTYEGKSVVFNIQTADGIFRAYTGKINLPDLDLNLRRLSITCTDNRRELINQNYVGIVNNLGYYSENIFGVAKDKAQELDNRLLTIPYTLNFDVYGIPNVSYSFASASPDYTFIEEDVYRDDGRDPHVILTPRSEVVNTINISYEYRYQRLYNTYCVYSWSTDIDCNFLTKGYSLTKRDIISSAVSAAGWPLVSPIQFTTNFQSGFYTCGGVATGFSWVETGYTNVAKTTTSRDGSGALITTNVVDAKGNQVYTAVPTSYIDHQSEYCDAADWTTYFRWAQNITENYTMTVAASQSVARFGEVSQDMNAGLSSTYDSKVWEDNTKPTPTASNTLVYGNSGLAYYWNENNNYANYVNDINVLLNKAKTTILKSHRNNRVIFNTFIFPQIDLKHTVLLDAQSFENTDVYAKGKVYAITHRLDPREGSCNTQIELALSISSGVTTDDVLSLPTRPSNNLLHEGFAINLDNHYGEDPTDHPEWNGFIGNKWVTVGVVGGSNTFRTQFPESFVVDTPTIEDAYRTNITLTGTADYDVDIIDDDLTIVL